MVFAITHIYVIKYNQHKRRYIAMKNKISIVILMLLSLFVYITPARSEVYMGSIGMNNTVEVTDAAHTFPVFFAFKQPPAIRPFSLYFIKKDAINLWYYKDGWQKVNSGNVNKLIPIVQLSDATEIDKLQFFNILLPLGFFTDGSSSWADFTVSICIDEENATTGIADMGPDNHNCGSLTFINKIGNGGGAPGGQVTTYTVTPSAGAGGTISPSTSQPVNANGTTSFTVTPNNGYTASVGGTCGGTLSGNTYTTGTINADCTVSATFTANNTATHLVTPSAGPNGSISPSSAQPIKDGFTTIFVVTPNQGYAASVGGTCGGNLAGTTYTTNVITKDCTVAATFSSTNPGGTPGGALGGGPPVGQCTASSSVQLFPNPVTFTAKQGQPVSPIDVTVADCQGIAVSYRNVSVTKGAEWLKVTSNSNSKGVFTVEVYNTNMAPNATPYQGIITFTQGSSTQTLNVSLTIDGQCVKQATASPSSITKPVSKGSTTVSDEVVRITDGCNGSLGYKVASVTAGSASSWITSPVAGDTGTGTLTIKFNAAGLSDGLNTGAIKLETALGSITIDVNANVSTTTSGSNTNAAAIAIYNNQIQYFSYAPGEVRYFYFIDSHRGDTTNKSQLRIEMMDMNASNGYNDIDMIAKYSGDLCDPANKPTVAELTAAKNGTLTPQAAATQGIYFNISSDAFESIPVPPPNPEGCWYVMVKNVSLVYEPKISIKWFDADAPSKW